MSDRQRNVVLNNYSHLMQDKIIKILYYKKLTFKTGILNFMKFEHIWMNLSVKLTPKRSPPNYLKFTGLDNCDALDAPTGTSMT